MSKVPTHPTWAHALLIAKDNDSVAVIALLLAILDGRSFVQSGYLADSLSDAETKIRYLLLTFWHLMKLNEEIFLLLSAEKVGINAVDVKRLPRSHRCYVTWWAIPLL